MGVTRSFDLYAVLSVTHRLPSKWSMHQAILEFITGTQIESPVGVLPARPACREWILGQHPQLRGIPRRPDFADDDYAGMDAWADALKRQYGAELEIAAMPVGHWQQPSLMEIVLLYKDPNRVHVVDPDRPGFGGQGPW
ncbi:hypothetical protein [Actinokineospora enzanensis]|uniref:hypothetical protein n=1 Tax=Actinokineospora enzanensis TaxID=155975 RepID=UPI00036391BA|nr:hypothetical protein [Actinokineospora enzanensis]